MVLQIIKLLCGYFMSGQLPQTTHRLTDSVLTLVPLFCPFHLLHFGSILSSFCRLTLLPGINMPHDLLLSCVKLPCRTFSLGKHIPSHYFYVFLWLTTEEMYMSNPSLSSGHQGLGSICTQDNIYWLFLWYFKINVSQQCGHFTCLVPV